MRLRMPMGAIAVALCVNVAAVLFNITNALAQNAPITDCDQLAAHPNDPQRKVDGIPLSEIDPNKAVPACETAVRQYPNDARLSYQLGRAYFARKITKMRLISSEKLLNRDMRLRSTVSGRYIQEVRVSQKTRPRLSLGFARLLNRDTRKPRIVSARCI